MNIDELVNYVPNYHGEHGVVSTIHRIIKKSSDLFEVYCNPPGASWSSIEINHHISSSKFIWNNIPRMPENTKRPDSIIQYNQDKIINFLLIESKSKYTDLEPGMSRKLQYFFTGYESFDGLFNRPTYHTKTSNSKSWKFIKNENDQKWISKKNITKNLYSGFAFAFDPEFIMDPNEFEKNIWLKKMKKILENNLDVVIGIGWATSQHEPFALTIFSDKFEKTDFAKKFKKNMVDKLKIKIK